MRKSLSELSLLQSLIIEEAKYKQAIIDNKEFEDVKTIYLRIRELQKQLTEVQAVCMKEKEMQIN